MTTPRSKSTSDQLSLNSSLFHINMLNTPFSPWPSFTQEEADAVSRVLLSNKVNYWTGQECREFEKEFAAWAGTRYAVALANGTAFGLVAGVWTKDGARQLRMARRLQCGQVFINNYGAGGGVELPFGGVKSSGYGREKGFEALYGFTTLKTVAIRHG